MSGLGNTVLQYSGVNLPLIKTDLFRQENIYSEDGVDPLYVHTTIGVTFVLSQCMLTGYTSAANWIDVNRPALMTRGAQLYFMLDGFPVINTTPPCTFSPAGTPPAPPTGSELASSPAYGWDGSEWDSGSINGSDSKKGPRPIRLEIRQIAGQSAICYYEIETWLPYCCNNGLGGIVLSNQWSVDVSIDEKFFGKRTVTGILVLNAQANTRYSVVNGADSNGMYYDGTEAGLPWYVVDQGIIIPPCPNRWKRDSVDISKSSDGLTLRYTIQDVEQYTATPRPCTKITADYSEVAGAPSLKDSGGFLNVQVCEMNITVWGAPNYVDWDPTQVLNGGLDVNKYKLIQIMFQVISSRITNPQLFSSPTTFQDTGEYITYFEMKESVFEPMVGCRIRTLKTRRPNANPIGITSGWTGSGFLQYTTIGSTINIDDVISDVPCQPTTLDNYAMLLITSATFCSTASGISVKGPCTDAKYYTIGGSCIANTDYIGTNVITVNHAQATPASGYAPTQQQNKFGSANYHYPFTQYSLDVQYPTLQHVFQLPIMYDVATTDISCRFAKTSAPTTLKLIHYKASRIGTWPMIPNPDNLVDNVNDRLLKHEETFAESTLLEDGQTVHYEVHGVYTYGLGKRLQYDASGTIPTVVNPITTDSWGSVYSTYPCSLYVNGIIGSGASPGA